LRPASSRGTRFQHGFTMVELIVVIVLIGIIGTIAVSRFFERSPFDAVAWTDQVRATLRYGQKVAIAQHRSVSVVLSADRVALCFDGAACEDRVLAPGGSNSGSSATRTACGAADWMCAGRPEGVAMTVPGTGFFFDALGRAGGAADAPLRIGIKGGGVERAIVIERETGYVD
jgi:MSHA pilin protein MshC